MKLTNPRIVEPFTPGYIVGYQGYGRPEIYYGVVQRLKQEGHGLALIVDTPGNVSVEAGVTRDAEVKLVWLPLAQRIKAFRAMVPGYLRNVEWLYVEDALLAAILSDVAPGWCAGDEYVRRTAVLVLQRMIQHSTEDQFTDEQLIRVVEALSPYLPYESRS